MYVYGVLPVRIGIDKQKHTMYGVTPMHRVYIIYKNTEQDDD